jgi:single-stranded-DNA-specific exonuclease
MPDGLTPDGLAAAAGQGATPFVAVSLSGRRWFLPEPDPRAAAAIAQREQVPELIGRLLVARGIGPDQAAAFLTPTLRALLPDPSTLTDMDLAATRLADAVIAGETVAVFGDYDVDGACAGALMALLLRGLGATVISYVPDRLTEGYGPNAPALRGLAARGATLIVCVDCGAAAAEPIAAVAGRADVLVLDHHKSDHLPLTAQAVVNPNRADDRSGLGMLCATGVAFLAAIACLRELRRRGHFAARSEPDLRDVLDLVALATVCDMMPLAGLNRALVTQGLKVMDRRDRPGISALLQAARAVGHPTAATCGFALGPRINAAGRISEAGLGLQLLLCEDPVEAAGLANALDAINRQRQDVEADILDEAMRSAEAQIIAGHPALLIAAPQWHPGVVGIVAGRVKERFNRPTCVAAIADGIARGSGRSVAGLDLGAAILAAQAAGLLLTGGGHAMACGFSLREADLPRFHAALDTALATARLLPQAPDLLLDAAVAVEGATIDLATEIDRLAPFGQANPEPLFLLPRARVVHAERLGRDGATIRAYLQGETGPRVKAMLFRAADTALGRALLSPDRAPLHLAGHLRCESWNGRTSLCIGLVDGAAVA